MSDLVGFVADLLLLAALLCGLALLVAAVVSVLLGIGRSLLGSSVYVLPFRGVDERRGELMGLFAQRLAELEAAWIELAQDIDDLRQGFAHRTREAAEAAANDLDRQAAEPAAEGKPALEPRAEGSARAALRGTGAVDVAAGPRTTGDEVVRDLLEVIRLHNEDHSLTDIDLGVVTVAGVSFSPQQVLAFLRRLPAAVARRRLHGSIVKQGDVSVVTVVFQQRPLGRFARLRYDVSCVVRVADDEWLAGLEDAAFRLERKRLELLRDKRDAADAPGPAPQRARASQTVALAEVEAQGWEACEAFLKGYKSQLTHYKTGAAVDRDEALAYYSTALALQPSYTRAAYNSATLLYNRYVPRANAEAIRRFAQATESRDPRVAALAHAGLAMAHCQAIHRFGQPEDRLLPKAFEASQSALALDPNLEEARFAVAWTFQVKRAWQRALDEYASVVALDTNSAAGNRIKSFALNNAGWIWLVELKRRSRSRQNAEAKFREALGYYPNKIAYANLAEVARLDGRYADALSHFDCALSLDGEYVNARNERACLKIEIAAEASDPAHRQTWLEDAKIDHARAVQLAGDPRYANQLQEKFEATLRRFRASLPSELRLAPERQPAETA